MENFYMPLSNTTTTTTAAATTTTATTTTPMTNLTQPNMGYVQNPQFFPLPNTQFYYPPQYLPTHQSLQFPYTYPIQHPDLPLAYPVYPFLQNGIQIGLPGPIQGSPFLQPNVSSREQERRSMDAYRSRLARIRRRLARRRSLANRNSSSGSSSSSAPSSTQVDAVNTDEQNIRINSNKDLYNFCTPDGKRLRVLLKKDLKNSDVGALGRIVLPKREAEENLPRLTEKEGIQVVLRNAYSNQEWSLKFKFWSNNKSRMYVLENTGDFVRQNGLESGDSLTLYDDENKNLYFSITKVEKPVVEEEPLNTQQPLNTQWYTNNDNYLYTPTTHQARDEEEVSLALLIEQLNHKEQLDGNNLMTLSMDGASSSKQAEVAKNDPLDNVTSMGTSTQSAEASMQPSSSTRGNVGVVHDCETNMDDLDYYSDLGTLPEYNLIL